MPDPLSHPLTRKMALIVSAATLFGFGALLAHREAPPRLWSSDIGIADVDRSMPPPTQLTAEAAPDADNAPATIADANTPPSDEPDEMPASDDPDAQVRKAATDLIKQTHPNSKVEGVFTLSFARGNLYIAGADTTTGEARRTIDMLVRLYTRRNGTTYWRAEQLSADEASKWRQRVKSDDSER